MSTTNYWWILSNEYVTHRLYPKTYVGRSRRNDIVISDPSVSRYQAMIEAFTTSITITNFGLMGTTVDGTNKPTATATEGSFIKMGNVYFQLTKEYIEDEPPTDDERDFIEQLLDTLLPNMPTIDENLDFTTDTIPTEGVYTNLTTAEPPQQNEPIQLTPMEVQFEKRPNTPYTEFLTRIGMDDGEYQSLLDEYSIDLPNNFNVRYTSVTRGQRNFLFNGPMDGQFFQFLNKLNLTYSQFEEIMEEYNNNSQLNN